jgi:hypothetical protein
MDIAAQQSLMTKTICDLEDMSPLALVNVQILDSKKGTMTNKSGQFELILKSFQSVKISAIGYASITLSFNALDRMDTVFLKREIVELDELKVYSSRMSANDIVRIAMGKTNKLSYSKPYCLNTFYRHSCSENDVYGRLIEAAVVLHDNKGHKKKYDSPDEKIGVEVNQIRRSFDFTKNFDEHDPISIYSTLKYDVYSYTSFLHFYPEDFNFQLIDTSFYDNALVWVISYEYSRQKEKNMNEDLVECKGQLLVRANDFGVIEVKERQEHIRKSEFEEHTYELEWKVKYQEHDGKYFLKYITEKGKNIDILKSTNYELVSKKDHTFQVEMMVVDLQFENLSKVSSKEPNKTELDNIAYDADFWENFTVIQSTPVDEKIIQDLEKRQSLESQFKK